jgi:hypothetical protein
VKNGEERIQEPEARREEQKREAPGAGRKTIG